MPAKKRGASRATARATRPRPRESPHIARRIVTCAVLAKELNLARSTVTRAAKPGGPLHPAQTEDGRIDLDDPAAIEWISEREDSDDVTAELPDLGEPMSIAEMEKLTLAEITERYGHIEQYYLHVRARKEFEQAARAQLQRDRMEGRLIPRTLVQDGFAAIDAAHRQLLTDAAHTIPVRLRGVQTPEEGRAIVRETISTILKNAKRSIKRRMASDDPSATLKDPRPTRKKDPQLEAIREGISAARSRVASKYGAMADRLVEASQRPHGLSRTDALEYIRQTLDHEFYLAGRELETRNDDENE